MSESENQIEICYVCKQPINAHAEGCSRVIVERDIEETNRKWREFEHNASGETLDRLHAVDEKFNECLKLIEQIVFRGFNEGRI